MKIFSFLILTAAVALHAGAAETYTREHMVEMVEQQEANVEKLTNEFFTLNEELERQLKTVVTTIASLEDSRDSKTRVTRMKQDLIDQLRTSIQTLNRQYAHNKATIDRMSPEAQGDAPEGLAAEILKEKMKERVDLVMTLANSLESHKDVQKYDYYFDTNGYYNNRNNNQVKVSKRKSDEFKQNRDQTWQTKQGRKDLLTGIEEAEFKLTQKRNHLIAEQKRLNSSEFQTDIDTTDEFLAILKERKMEVLSGKNSVPTESVDSAARAMEIERQLSEVVRKLQIASGQLRQSGAQLKAEITRLNAQQAALEKHDAAK